MVTENAVRLEQNLAVVVADGRHPALRANSVDQVLVDAPCSGLGSLRRRPDARWRIDPETPERLGRLQRQLLQTALPLVKSGGRVVYSVCTMTAAENIDVVGGLDWEAVTEPALRLPDAESDGMWSQVFLAP